MARTITNKQRYDAYGKMQRNRAYWKRRALALEGDKEAQSEALTRRVKKVYRESFRAVETEINALVVEIARRFELGEPITRSQLYQINKYQTVKETLAREITALASFLDKNLTEHVQKLALDVFGVNMAEFGREFNIIGEFQARAIASMNWSGAKFSERIWGNADAFNQRVLEDIEKAVIGGVNPDTLKKRLMEDFERDYSQADRLIRTESSHAYNTAAIESYKDAGCEYVEFLAEDDCCEDCAVWAEENGGRYKIESAPAIPVHPNCRCTYVPIVDLE